MKRIAEGFSFLNFTIFISLFLLLENSSLQLTPPPPLIYIIIVYFVGDGRDQEIISAEGLVPILAKDGTSTGVRVDAIGTETETGRETGIENGTETETGTERGEVIDMTRREENM